MPLDTSAVQQDFAHMRKMHMTDQPDAYGCVSLWWLGSVAVEISPTPVSMMSSSVCSRDPHHKHGISAHEVVFVKWAYLQETILQPPMELKFGPLSKSHKKSAS